MTLVDWVITLFLTILGAAIYDSLKYGAKHIGKIIPPVKRFHQNLFELRNLAVGNLQISYDFYARAFAFALLYGSFALGIGAGLNHRYFSPVSTASNEVWYYVGLLAFSICTYMTSLWLGSVLFISKIRLDYFRQQMLQNNSGSTDTNRENQS